MNGGVRITGTCRDRPRFEKRGTDLNIKKIGLSPIIKVCPQLLRSVPDYQGLSPIIKVCPQLFRFVPNHLELSPIKLNILFYIKKTVKIRYINKITHLSEECLKSIFFDFNYLDIKNSNLDI